MSFMGGLLSEVCCLRMGQANTEWYQHFFPRSISICSYRCGAGQVKALEKDRPWKVDTTQAANSRAARLCASRLRCTVSVLSPAWCSSAPAMPCSLMQNLRQTKQWQNYIWGNFSSPVGGESWLKQCMTTFYISCKERKRCCCSSSSYLTLSGDSTERPSRAQASLVKMLQISAHWFVSSRLRYGELSMPWRRYTRLPIRIWISAPGEDMRRYGTTLQNFKFLQ